MVEAKVSSEALPEAAIVLEFVWNTIHLACENTLYSCFTFAKSHFFGIFELLCFFHGLQTKAEEEEEEQKESSPTVATALWFMKKK